MELNEYWSAHAVEEYKGMLHEMQDGNQWCCILGDLPTGVVGFGDTPKAACDEFDRVWNEGN